MSAGPERAPLTRSQAILALGTLVLVVLVAVAVVKVASPLTEVSLLLLIGVLIGSVAYSVLRQPHVLRQEVERRTRELAAINQQLHTEVEQRRQAEAALKASEDRYRQMFERNQAVKLVIDAEAGVIVDANPMAAAFYGYSLDQLKGMKLADITAQPAWQVAADLQRAASERQAYFTVPHRLASGEVREVEVYSSPLGLEGEATVFAIIHDITERSRAEQALKETQRTLSTLMSNLPGMAYRAAMDGAWTMHIVSEGCLELTGYRPDEIIDNRVVSYGQLIDLEDRDRVWAKIEDAVRQQKSFQVMYRITTKAGQEKWVWEQGRGVFASDGQLEAIEGFVTDMTERALSYQLLEQLVEERTQEIEQRRRVAESLRDILRVLNSTRTLKEIMDHIVAKAGEVLGASAAAVYRLDNDTLHIEAAQGLDADYVRNVEIPYGVGAAGRAVRDRRPAATANRFRALDSFQNDPNSLQFVTLSRQLTGRFAAVLAVPLLIKDEVYGSLAVYYPEERDFSDEDVRLAAAFGDQVALSIENARLREQAEQNAIAAERNRLARDLHDAVTQTLFSASLIAEVLPRIWQRNPEEGQRRLEELRQLTRGALAEMRALLLELRPSALEEMPLADLLQQLAEAITGRARLPVKVEIEGHAELPSEVQITLYRIAQEALNNVVHHSGAQHVEVLLRYHEDGVELRITDDGAGFDQGTVPAGHLGLRIMQERADAIGARLAIDSKAGRGTVVNVRWTAPVRAAVSS